MVTCAVGSIVPQCLKEFEGMESDRVKFFAGWQATLFGFRRLVRNGTNLCQSQRQSVALRNNGSLSCQPPDRRRTIVHKLVKGNKGFPQSILVLNGTSAFKILAKFSVSIFNRLFGLPLFSVNGRKKLQEAPFDRCCQNLEVFPVLPFGNESAEKQASRPTKRWQTNASFSPPCKYCSDM